MGNGILGLSNRMRKVRCQEAVWCVQVIELKGVCSLDHDGKGLFREVDGHS